MKWQHTVMFVGILLTAISFVGAANNPELPQNYFKIASFVLLGILALCIYVIYLADTAVEKLKAALVHQGMSKPKGRWET